MFTGIVEEVGTVRSLQRERLTVRAKEVLEGSRPGDSIDVNGACLTVIEMDKNSFAVELIPETRRRTNLGGLRPGDGVNLERALALGGRLGGHLVQGHVDGTGRVVAVTPEEEALLLRVSAPPELMPYIVQKGFIAVDGVSLTVVDADANATSFTVSLVGYTRQHTNLGGKKPGDVVNLEVDILAKYVERLMGAKPGGITLDFLAEHGFLKV
jgi:riboflavin synthase